MPSSTNNLFLGYREDGRPFFLTPAERATHAVIVGCPGSGKTTLQEVIIRQDLLHGRGPTTLETQGALTERLLEYSFFLAKHRGATRETILFEPAQGDWVTPF